MAPAPLILISLAALGLLCALAGLIRLLSALLHFARRDFAGSFLPLEAKLSQTLAAVDATNARIDSIDGLVARADSAVATIVKSREGLEETGRMLGRSVDAVRKEFHRLRGVLN